MAMRDRPEIPEKKIFEIKRNTKKIDFTRPYEFIYFDVWFHLLTLPLFMVLYTMATFCRLFFGLQKDGKLPKEDLTRMSETAVAWMKQALVEHHEERPV